MRKTYHLRRLTTYLILDNSPESESPSGASFDFYSGGEYEFGKEKNAMDFETQEQAQSKADLLDQTLVRNSNIYQRLEIV